MGANNSKPTSSNLYHFYYQVKPFIPRRLQVLFRQKRARNILARHTSDWFIDASSGQSPPGWVGWPEGKKFSFVLTHDVERQIGHDASLRLMDLEKDLGFKSSFNFVPERYTVDSNVLKTLRENGFEIGVHDLNHDGKLFKSKEIFDSRYQRINHYLSSWNAVGFRAGAMHRNLEWIKKLDIKYDASTFDIDPFELQSGGEGTIFPFYIEDSVTKSGYAELPYTLPQDFTLFVILGEKTNDIWKRKLDWIVENGGMALFIVHPDYLAFDGKPDYQTFPVDLYSNFLEYVSREYSGEYWNALPSEVAGLIKNKKNIQVPQGQNE